MSAFLLGDTGIDLQLLPAWLDSKFEIVVKDMKRKEPPSPANINHKWEDKNTNAQNKSTSLLNTDNEITSFN